MGRVFKWVNIIILLLVGGGALVLWLRVENRTMRVLQPVSPLYKGYSDLPDRAEGVRLTPFEYEGYDKKKGLACIVTGTGEEGGKTPIQQALLEKLLPERLDNLGSVDYVLICVDWDHGIRSALPLAETLAATGLSCVLWEPRGKNSAREYSTRGLLESKDIPLIIDALEQISGKKDLLIFGIGRGYGAELMIHAATKDQRLRAIAGINACTSLSSLLKRSGVSVLMRELISHRMETLTGLEPFDIAAVKSVFALDRQTPVLLIYTEEPGLESSPDDSIAMFTQLHPAQRQLATLRRADDPPHATTRDLVFVQKGGTHEIKHHLTADLLQDADEIPALILRWMNQHVPALLETPAPLPQSNP